MFCATTNNQGIKSLRKAKTNFPIIIVRPESEEQQSDHIPATSSSSGFSNHRRTAPAIIGNSKDKKKHGLGGKIEIWPFHLEEKYVFEELHIVETPYRPGRLYEKQRLLQQVDFHKTMIPRFGQGLALPKKRIGRIRKDRLRCQLETEFSVSGNFLDLSNKGVRILTRNIALYRNLTILDLSGNELRNLPDEIGIISSLRELNLSHNRLHELPNTIGLLHSLKEMFLENNELSGLPKSVSLLQQLRVLKISNNRISSIPREAGNLISLTTLEIRNNRIEWLPAEVSLLKQLRYIALEGNPLVTEEFACAKQKEVCPRQGSLSLLEMAGRMLIRENKPLIPYFPYPLLSFLERAEECVYCHGPLIETKYGRLRFLQRMDNVIPFMYFLCSAHWNDERGRLRALFTEPPETAPKKVYELKRTGSASSSLEDPSRAIRSSSKDKQHVQTKGALLSAIKHKTNLMNQLPPKYISLHRSSLDASVGNLRELTVGDGRSILIEENWAKTWTEIIQSRDH